MKKIIVGITGASGSVYAIDLVQALLDAAAEVHLIISDLGAQVLAHEFKTDDDAELFHAMRVKTGTGATMIIHSVHDMFAPVASGSFQADAMVIIPCSMKTLASVALGYTTNLLERAADVTLKEKRPLILVTRESPLSRVHLTNMLKAHDAGATIMPASPGFYQHPRTIQDLVDSVVARVLDHLKIASDLIRRWGAEHDGGQT